MRRWRVHPGGVMRNGRLLNEPYVAEDPDYDLKIVGRQTAQGELSG